MSSKMKTLRFIVIGLLFMVVLAVILSSCGERKVVYTNPNPVIVQQQQPSIVIAIPQQPQTVIVQQQPSVIIAKPPVINAPIVANAPVIANKPVVANAPVINAPITNAPVMAKPPVVYAS